MSDLNDPFARLKTIADSLEKAENLSLDEIEIKLKETVEAYNAARARIKATRDLLAKLDQPG